MTLEEVINNKIAVRVSNKEQINYLTSDLDPFPNIVIRRILAQSYLVRVETTTKGYSEEGFYIKKGYKIINFCEIVDCQVVNFELVWNNK